MSVAYCEHCKTRHLPEDPDVEYWMTCPFPDCGKPAFRLTRKPEHRAAATHDLIVGGVFRMMVPPCVSCGRRCMDTGAFKTDLVKTFSRKDSPGGNIEDLLGFVVAKR